MKAIFNAYPTGLAAIGAMVDGVAELMLTSSFTVGVSHRPPMCSVAIQMTSTTWPRLSRATHLGVSALGLAHAEAIPELASRDTSVRFRSVNSTVDDNGAIYIDGSALWMECELVDTHEIGDHLVVFFRVAASRTTPDRPLVLQHGVVVTT